MVSSIVNDLLTWTINTCEKGWVKAGEQDSVFYPIKDHIKADTQKDRSISAKQKKTSDQVSKTLAKNQLKSNVGRHDGGEWPEKTTLR